MLGFLARLLFKISGWQVVGKIPPEAKKCVMIAAPHTSNWDLVFARAAFYIMDVPLKYTIKKEWMDKPIMGPMLKAFGAIPIERTKQKGGMVQAMAKLFNQYHELAIMVTPEGTRKFVPKWRTGFYHTAVAGGVPIVLGYLDYDKKHAGIGEVVYPSGDIQGDMERILNFYSKIIPRHPLKGVILSKMSFDYQADSLPIKESPPTDS
jgi:1-acyl-sn-glycerol-3-phosphate acyltransferase